MSIPYECNKRVCLAFLAAALILFQTYSRIVTAAAYTYQNSVKNGYPTAMDACLGMGGNADGWGQYPQSNFSVSAVTFTNGLVRYKCYFDISDTVAPGQVQVTKVGPYPIIRNGDSCEAGNALDIKSGKCITSCAAINETLNISTGICGHDQQKGIPTSNSCVGNPINIAVGNKFQVETDYQSAKPGGAGFSRYYNSLDGVWRHSYATFIRFSKGTLSLVKFDGSESFYIVADNIATPIRNDGEALTKVGDNWVYRDADSNVLTFDGSGHLIEWSNPIKPKQHLTYSGQQVSVRTDNGETFTIIEDVSHQPISFSAPGIQIDYNYSGSFLSELFITRGTQVMRRKFYYEDARDQKLLTGITDERGVRFATWSYDDKGRAVSSEHSGGAGLTRVSYNSDDSSTVTNELGKSTVYSFQQIGGVRQVIGINGEPAPNCAASNTSFTYDNSGMMHTRTDAKGFITTYTYNDRGLETSRTEASGTPQARVTTTEWDPTRFLRTKVVEPTRTTVYTYDDQGRETGRQVSAR